MLRRNTTVALYVTLIALLIGSYGWIFYLRFFASSEYDRLSRVIDRAGAVSTTKPEGNVIDTFVGMSLVSRDMVSTGEGSGMALNIDRINARMEIDERSLLLVDELSSAKMRLSALFRVMQGQVYSSVHSKLDDSSYFAIRTDEATFSTRDADFTTVVSGDRTASISVLRGSGHITYMSEDNRYLTIDIEAGQSVRLDNGTIQIVQMNSSNMDDYTKLYAASLNYDASEVAAYQLPENQWQQVAHRTHHVRIVVVNVSGQAIAGAIVSIGEQAYRTDNTGAILHKTVDGNYEYTISSPGFVPGTGMLRVNGSSIELHIPLIHR